jgi:glutathione reductase (NADPH)
MYDFLVIGGGSGGVRAARLAASFGAKVALVEKSNLGGTCVNLGCVPKKLFVYASEFAHTKKIAEGYGWDINDSFDWQRLVENKNKEIKRLNAIYEDLLQKHNVDILFGKAEIIANNEVRVNEKTYSSKKILIATGGYPFLPEVPGIEHACVSDDVFFLKKLPKSIAIVGAGYIAIEFAGIFHSLGVQTTLIHRNQNLLRGFEEEAVQHLITEMKQKGVNFLLDCNIEKITANGEQKTLHFQGGNQKVVDLVFYAVGRKPNLEGMNTEKLGIEFANNGGIAVNEFFQTSNENIFAVGDIINHVNLTPVAIRQAVVVANYLFNDKKIALDYKKLPSAVFSQPNLASVGYKEKEAAAEFEIEVFRAKLTPMKYSLSDYKEQALLKLIVEKKTQQVLGVHMVGPEAGEIIQIFAFALQANCTKQDLDKTIGVHPSLAEEWATMK